MPPLFESVYKMPNSAKFEDCLLFLLFASIIYGCLSKYVHKVSDKINDMTEFSRTIFNDLINHMYETRAFKKQANDQLCTLLTNSEEFKTRLENLECAFKKLVVDETLIVEEELENLHIKKTYAWSTKSLEKYNLDEKSLTKRSLMYTTLQKFL
jgi:hypothetical protein